MGRSVRILHLEDREADAQRLEQALSRAGFEPQCWRVPHAAAWEAALQGESWDLMIASCAVPGFDAVRAARLLQERDQETPLLLLAERGAEDRALEAVRAGAEDCLRKDDLSRLGPVVERALRQAGVRRARRLAEQALSASEASLAFARRVACLAAWELDLTAAAEAGGKPWRWSEELFRLFGQVPGSVAPSSEGFFKAIHPEDRDRVRHALEAAVRDGQPGALQLRLRRPDGSERLVRACWETLREPATGRPLKLLGLLEDLTEERRAAEARAALEARAQRGQQMEALGRLAAGIAHDFNNLLAAILGHAELLQADLPTDHPGHEGLSEILKASRRARDLVDQMLVLRRRREAGGKPVRLQEVLSESLRLLRAALPVPVVIEPHLPAGGPDVWAEPTQIHQLILSLGSRLGRAMDERGGRLAVSLTPVTVPAAGAASKGAPALRVQVCLSAVGEALDATALERALVQPTAVGATGEGGELDWEAAQQLIQHRGGTLTLGRPPDGRGLTVRLEFPALAPLAPAEAAGPPSGPAGRGEHVLVVDDEEALARLAVTSLERLGYRATAVTTPAEALAVLHLDPAAVQVLVTDLTMPQMSGLALARQFRSLRPDLPIILASGYSDTVDREQMRAAGVAELLAKPFSLETLAETLRRVLQPGPAA